MLGDDPDHADLRSFALDSRTFTLQNLDRWPDAELALRTAREHARRSGRPDGSTWASAAVLRYWLGQWDDALAELGSDEPDDLGPTHSYLREHWSALLVHGVAALIAGRRDQRVTAGHQLRLGLALPILTIPDRENQDFLLAAHALALEQGGDTGAGHAGTGRDPAAPRRRDDPDPPVAACPCPARDRQPATNRPPGPPRSRARRRPRRRPIRPGRRRRACAARDCWPATRLRSPRPSTHYRTDRSRRRTARRARGPGRRAGETRPGG